MWVRYPTTIKLQGQPLPISLSSSMMNQRIEQAKRWHFMLQTKLFAIAYLRAVRYIKSFYEITKGDIQTLQLIIKIQVYSNLHPPHQTRVILRNFPVTLLMISLFCGVWGRKVLFIA